MLRRATPSAPFAAPPPRPAFVRVKGDWLEAHVDLQKIGRRLVFANAYLVVGSERNARVSAVFARNVGALAAPPPGRGTETASAGGDKDCV